MLLISKRHSCDIYFSRTLAEKSTCPQPREHNHARNHGQLMYDVTEVN